MPIRVVAPREHVERRLSFTTEDGCTAAHRHRHTRFILRTRGISRDGRPVVRVINATIVPEEDNVFSNGVPMKLNPDESNDEGLLQWDANVILEHDGDEFKYFYSLRSGMPRRPELDTVRIGITPTSPFAKCILVDNINFDTSHRLESRKLAPKLKRIHFHLRCKIPKNARVFLVCEWGELYLFDMRTDTAEPMSRENFTLAIEVWPDCHKLMYDYQVHNSGGISTPARALDLNSANYSAVEGAFIVRDSLLPGCDGGARAGRMKRDSVNHRKPQRDNEIGKYVKDSGKQYMIQAWREQALHSSDPESPVSSVALYNVESFKNSRHENVSELDQLGLEIDSIHEQRFGDISKLREEVRMLRAECSEIRRRSTLRR